MTDKCSKCKGCKNEYEINCVGFSGNPNADIYFLGEMAGDNEAKATAVLNKPAHFIGKAGGILDNLLDLINLKRKDIAIANSHRCYKKGNTKPTKKELDACFEYTLKEIQEINPKLVVTLGGTALYQGTGKEGISTYHGNLVYSEKLQCNVFPVYHPMAIGYDPSKKADLIKDFRRIPSLIDEEEVEIVHYSYKYVDKIENFTNFSGPFHDLLTSYNLYFDIETTGLNPYDSEGRITLLQLGTENNIYVIDGGILEGLKPFLKELFDAKDIIGQDFTFDAKWMYLKLGIEIKHWKFDTCLAEFVISGMKDNDLTALTCKYVPESIGYDDKVHQAGGAHLIEDQDDLRQYAADDIGVLRKIMKTQTRALVKADQLSLFKNIMMPCNRILTEMSLHGVKYNLDELWKVDSVYEKEANRASVKAMNLEGVKACEKKFEREFNPRSPLMLRWLLFDYYKLPVKKTTATKLPSTDKNVMKSFVGRNKYCRIMEKYRSIQGIRENFLSGVIPKLVDGVAHTKYSLHATATGRPNSREPNLLNVPREKDIKRILIARPGYKFVYSDFATLEIRGASVVYNDDNLIEACNRGGDFHSQVAASVNNMDYDEFYSRLQDEDKEIKELRQAAKDISFGVLYQMSAWALAKAIGVTEEEAEIFIHNYFKKFPQLRENIDKIKRFVVKNGYVRNYYGFTRRWDKHGSNDHATIREAVNFPIQSICWNWEELAMIQIEEQLKERRMDSCLNLQVYDAIVCHSPDEEVEETGKIMQDVMQNVNKPYPQINKVQLIAEVEVGNNLADMKKIM